MADVTTILLFFCLQSARGHWRECRDYGRMSAEAAIRAGHADKAESPEDLATRCRTALGTTIAKCVEASEQP